MVQCDVLFSEGSPCALHWGGKGGILDVHLLQLNLNNVSPPCLTRYNYTGPLCSLIVFRYTALWKCITLNGDSLLEIFDREYLHIRYVQINEKLFFNLLV